ncbi:MULTISPECIES: DUF4224 domain-containing protein [unclassified Duganella]|uniref:DUF4224 domain-containing protein n=1 Tax=unclassified Duganella TaxID=2636909 RepID=UPI0008890A44|nr:MULTISPECIES: DUF4224 domain-containing protein [unclassified Duganella]SDH05316.1 protein of unknown function [Duganella sp. OV458]SDK20865.1 protein of unknown function [Duganella sp. OV510]
MNYLTASELAELVECKPNQRSKMVTWLTSNRWKFEIGSTGLPRVARAYHDRKLGIIETKVHFKHAEEPNLQAFA